MATNFPTSADSFTNPSASDSMATVSHAAQHTNVNDAVEAIETALLDGAPLHIDDANERVGIGTTSPSQSLDVNGKAIVGGGDNQTPDALGNGHLMIAGNGYTGFASLDGTAMWIGHNSASRNLYLATDETARLRIDSSGRVTMPYQPAFEVTRSSGFTSGQVVPYNTENYDNGNNFSSSRFTAPVTGVYFFYWTNIGLNSSGDVHRYYLRVNGTNTTRQLRLDQTYAGGGYTQTTQNAIVPLTASDYVEVYYVADSGSSSYGNNAYTRFGGYLLG